MYELPPPPAVDEEDPRVRQRRVAATLGEALEITPYWKGELAPATRWRWSAATLPGWWAWTS